MQYFQIKTLGDEQNAELVFLDNRPKELENFTHELSFGEKMADHFPDDITIRLEDKSPAIKLSSLLGNSFRYLVVNTALKDVIIMASKRLEIETFSFTLINHKGRTHSTDYWIVNPIGSIDCLNKAQSDIKYTHSDPKKPIRVRKFVFDPAKLAGNPAILRVPEERSCYFINEDLRNAIKENGFTNIYLREIELQGQ